MSEDKSIALQIRILLQPYFHVTGLLPFPSRIALSIGSGLKHKVFIASGLFPDWLLYITI